MLDNQINEYKTFLFDLENSNDPVFRTYSSNIQLASNIGNQSANLSQENIFQKWQRNLQRYASSDNLVASQYATLVLDEFLKLANSEITVDDFKNNVPSNSDDSVLDISSINYIRNCIINLPKDKYGTV
jgi:hypothetical protein